MERNELTTEQGNELIARFMGLYHEDSSNKYKFSEPNKAWAVFDKGFYHSSWDWLMPVVEKIDGLGYNGRVSLGGGLSIEDPKIQSRLLITSNRPNSSSWIEAVWKSVVQFLQWYYQTQSSNKVK